MKGGGDEGLAVVVLRAEAISRIGGGGVVLVLVVLAMVESARPGQVGSGCRAGPDLTDLTRPEPT